jgi:hypothetical protein
MFFDRLYSPHEAFFEKGSSVPGMWSLIRVSGGFVLSSAAAVTERSGDPGGNSHDGRGKGLYPIISDAEDRPGDADGCNYLAGTIPKRRSDAAKAWFPLLIIDRIASLANRAQLRFEFRGCGDGPRRVSFEPPPPQKVVDVILGRKSQHCLSQ